MHPQGNLFAGGGMGRGQVSPKKTVLRVGKRVCAKVVTPVDRTGVLFAGLCRALGEGRGLGDWFCPWYANA
ncbi:hypothetical protein GCM10022398_04960 [Acetobacter lovaniensis]|nr:hypothetical protein AA0474_2957 [Acetobacter lovaniensis NRIC 0474]